MQHALALTEEEGEDIEERINLLRACEFPSAQSKNSTKHQP